MASAGGWEYQRPYIYPKQLDAIFNDCRYAFIEASTKSGKTHGCIVWLLEQALMAEEGGRNYWWVAPVNTQAEIAFTRIKRALPKEIYKANENDKKITLINGSIIWFKSGDNPDSLYGEDVYAAVIDEGSRCKHDVFIAVRSTLTATRGPIRVIGNVKGRLTWTYKLGRKAKRHMEQGGKTYHYAKLTAWDAVAGGILDAEEVIDAQELLPRDVFNELYLAEPSDDGGNPFGIKDIENCLQGAISKNILAGPFYIGIDVAKKNDWFVVVVLNSLGEIVHFDRWQGPWEMAIPRAAEIIRMFPMSRTLIDSTGQGDPVVTAIQQYLNNNFVIEGYNFSLQSKQKLMEGLAISIQRQAVGILEGVMKDECDAFGYEYTKTGVRYSAPEGDHDDTVMALALANFQFYTPDKGWASNPDVLRELYGLSDNKQNDNAETELKRAA